MKKALIVLLILAVAGGLFADPSWGGSVVTGATFDFGEDGVPVTATDDDSGDAVHASLSFNNGGDNWGITVGASAGVNSDAEVSDFGLGDANGWVSFGMFKLTAGKDIGGAWGTGGNTDTDISSSAAGIRFEIMPIDGLDFGFRLGYPNGGAKAEKVANFLQETGIGFKYSADAWNLAAGLDLDSEETTGDALDGLAYFGFNFTGLDIVTIHVGAKIENLFTDAAVTLFEKINGSVAGLNWYVQANEAVTADPLAIEIEAGVSYPFTINDEASGEVGAKANLSYADDFNFDGWELWAQVKYAFSGTNAWTQAKLDIAGTMGDDSKVSPALIWTMGFSF